MEDTGIAKHLERDAMPAAHSLGLSRGRCALLQKIPKLLDGQPGITNDTAKGKGVDRIMAWDRQNACAV